MRTPHWKLGVHGEKECFILQYNIEVVKHMNWDSLSWYVFWKYKKQIAKAQDHAHSMNRDWLCHQGKPWYLGFRWHSPSLYFTKKKVEKANNLKHFPRGFQWISNPSSITFILDTDFLCLRKRSSNVIGSTCRLPSCQAICTFKVGHLSWHSASL